jgi:hypothetical protein
MSDPTTLLVYEPDHKGKAEAALLYQFRTKPRIVALVRALAAGVQLLEDTIFDVIIGTQLDMATGVNLDRWGDMVGEARDGLTDFQYRPFIRGRILANRSTGKTDDLIRVFQEITAPSSVEQYNLYPAAFVLYAYRNEYSPEIVRNRIRKMMLEIKPAGIEMELTEVAGGYFGFQEDPVALGFDFGVFARSY